MKLDFHGKVALVTGASSGIGDATAREFSKSGCDLMLTGRNEKNLIALKASLKNESGKIEFLSGDISDINFRKNLIEKTINIFGRLDILVNSAGIIGMGTIETTSLEDYDRMLDINLRSVFHLIQLSISHLEKTKGNVVNVSSVAGTRSFPGIFSYCVSKGGVDQLSRCAALELAPKGIRVNAVNPGVVVTRLHLNSGMADPAYKRFLEHSKTTHPLGRVGQAEEVADLIVFLASGSAGWITGATFGIDGGRAQTCAR
jgi:NAD(P)-dependent dehydrogenase (short-subunit alcohol dehydrogenase family)